MRDHAPRPLESVQIARRYIRQGARWYDNPASNLGL
jgi:hypothetical protein